MSLASKSLKLFSRDIFLYTVRLITSVVIARSLGPATMGLWIVLTMIPSYAEAIGRLKFDVAAVYYLGKGKYRLGEITFALNILALFFSVILISVFLWHIDFFYIYLFKGTPGTKSLVYLILLYIPFHFIFMNYSYLLIHLEDVKSYNYLLIIKELLSSSLSIAFLIILKWGLFSLIISTLIGGFTALLYGVWKVQRIEKMVPNFNTGMIKELFKYSSSLYLVGLVSQLNTYVSSLIVAFYLLPAQVAFFRMGQDKAQLLNKIPDAINTILYPRISKVINSGREAENLAARSCRISFLLLSILAIIGAFLIKPMVIILYGKQYLQLTISFWIFLPGLIFLGATSTLSHYFMGIGRPKILLMISSIPLVAQIVMGIMFIPIFGIIGAATATSLTFIIISLATLVTFKRLSKVSLTNAIFPSNEDIKIILEFVQGQVRELSLARFRNKLVANSKLVL